MLGQQLPAEAPLMRLPGVLAARRPVILAFVRLLVRDELMGTAANQVRPPHRHQRLAQQGPVLRIMVAQKGLVQPAPPGVLDDIHPRALVAHPAQRILAQRFPGLASIDRSRRSFP